MCWRRSRCAGGVGGSVVLVGGGACGGVCWQRSRCAGRLVVLVGDGDGAGGVHAVLVVLAGRLYSLAVVHVVACVLAAFVLCWWVGRTCRRWRWCWHVCWRRLRQCWWCWRWPGHSYFMNRLREGDEQEFHAERMRVVLVCCCSWCCRHTRWCWRLCWWHSR